MPAETVTARELAWEADRIAWADLTPEQERWFANLELFVNRELARLDQAHEDTGVNDQTAALCSALDIDEPVDAGDAAEIVAARLKLEREEGKKDALVPSRNDARTKGMRLLVEARLFVVRYDTGGEHKGLIHAKCRGDSGHVYDLGYDPHAKKWRCTCEEKRGNCSHLAALKMVTTTT